MTALFFVHEAWAAWTALGLYTYACVTDYIDGWLARAWGAAWGARQSTSTR